jgi:fatty-acyl-CoA synthase
MCKGRIAHYKIPRYWMVVEDRFPMTVTGKVQKFKVRDMAIAQLGLTGQTVQTTATWRDHTVVGERARRRHGGRRP